MRGGCRWVGAGAGGSGVGGDYAVGETGKKIADTMVGNVILRGCWKMRTARRQIHDMVQGRGFRDRGLWFVVRIPKPLPLRPP